MADDNGTSHSSTRIDFFQRCDWRGLRCDDYNQANKLRKFDLKSVRIQVGVKVAQSQHFINSMLRDRNDIRAVGEYEEAARLLGVPVYSGGLVKKIVILACEE